MDAHQNSQTRTRVCAVLIQAIRHGDVPDRGPCSGPGRSEAGSCVRDAHPLSAPLLRSRRPEYRPPFWARGLVPSPGGAAGGGGEDGRRANLPAGPVCGEKPLCGHDVSDRSLCFSASLGFGERGRVPTQEPGRRAARLGERARGRTSSSPASGAVPCLNHSHAGGS